MKIKYFILSLLAILVILSGVNTASATNIGIKNNNITKVLNSTACTVENINVGADTSYRIVVSNIPASCMNKPLFVQIIASDQPTTKLFTGATASNVTFSNAIVNPATVTEVKIAIAGWQVPAKWVWDLPALYIDASTPDVSISNSWTQYSSTSFCVTSTISTISSNNISWVMNLVVSKYPFNGDADTTHYSFSPSGNYGFISTTPVNGILQISGTKVPTQRVKSGVSQTVTICNSTTPLP